MDDLISRKALIAEYDRVHVGPPGGARKLIEEAPEVKPGLVVEIKIDNDALQGAVDEAVEHIKAELFGNSEQLDTISRQAAIDAANDWFLDCFNVKKQDRSCGLIRRLENLPTIKPRRNGNWVSGRCSECGRHALFWRLEMDYYESNFCPHCGADMREEKDGG